VDTDADPTDRAQSQRGVSPRPALGRAPGGARCRPGSGRIRMAAANAPLRGPGADMGLGAAHQRTWGRVARGFAPSQRGSLILRPMRRKTIKMLRNKIQLARRFLGIIRRQGIRAALRRTSGYFVQRSPVVE